jgi:hypothetical protein
MTFADNAPVDPNTGNAPVVTYTTTPNWIEYWALDENTGTNIAGSSCAINGTLEVGKGADWVTGKVNSAIDFTGGADQSGNISIPYDIRIKPVYSPGLTYTFWVKYYYTTTMLGMMMFYGTSSLYDVRIAINPSKTFDFTMWDSGANSDDDRNWGIDGIIDEIRMYNIALSTAQIQANYNATK